MELGVTSVPSASGTFEPYRSSVSHPVRHHWIMAGEFDDIRARLEAIAEELTDLAISRLLDSIDAGGTEFPVDEKRLTRARRSVEKAISILREPDDLSNC